MHGISDGLVRYTTTAAFTYTEALPATTSNGLWYSAYAWLFPDVDAMHLLAANTEGLEVYTACADILKAYVMIGLVDMYGDIPYSQALQGTDVISPGVDDGADVYAAAEQLLRDAIALLETTDDASPRDDVIYGGDKAKWITAAKTMILKIGVSTRLIGGASKITEIVNGGDFIDDASENLVIQFSTERNNPNSRHPFYNNHYESDDGTYMGNYFMWLMAEEKDSRSFAIQDCATTSTVR